MTLDQARPGQRFKVKRIDDRAVRAQAIRFGIGEGSEVTCQDKIPAGPVIIRKGLQEIAVGRGLAQRIKIELVRESGNQGLL